MGFIKKKINQSEFVKNIFVLLTGTTFAQLIPILTAFVLTRLYTPSDYGIMGVFLTIVTILGSLATLQYNNVIIVGETEKDAKYALSLVVFLTSVISIVTLFAVFFFNNLICDLFNKPELSSWLYFVPYSVFLTGWILGFTGWLNRKKSFRLMSFSRISGALIIALISVGLGFYFKGPIGLLLGQLVSQLIVAAILAYNYFFKEKNILYFEFTSIRQVASKYINFPRYSFPADFIYQVINQLPVLMMTRYSVNLISVGLFNFSNRILGLPSMVVATAISEVFKQRAVQDYYEKGSCRTIFIKVLKSLVVTAILPFLVLLIWGPDIFEFCFGSKWRGAGEYSQILAVMIFFRFIASPLSFIFTIAQKQKLDFALHILILISVGSVFLIGFSLGLEMKTILLLYAVVYSLIYIVYLLLSYKFTNRYE